MCVTDIKSRDDVMKMGIAAYNEECRSIVMRYEISLDYAMHACPNCGEKVICMRVARQFAVHAHTLTIFQHPMHARLVGVKMM